MVSVNTSVSDLRGIENENVAPCRGARLEANLAAGSCSP